MIRLSEIKLTLSQAQDPAAPLRAAAAGILGLAPADIVRVDVFKRSFDARKAELMAVFIVDVELIPGLDATLLAKFPANPHIQPTPDMAWNPPAKAPANLPQRPVVVGFGPCGIFAALALAQMGFNPIVLERGKTVRERTRDTWSLWRKNILNPESNVQFGEGGAGTFSDGKLYSQIKDPKFIGRKVLHEFVKAGAPDEILYVSKPHIGTFKLVKVVENLREQIIALGGEIRFGQRVTDVLIEDGHLRGLTVLDQATGQSHELRAYQVVMALGHSSRDTFAMLYARGVHIE
ncbi:MAG: NAD(P)/FAD-dependent oxidoreductase, partial [Gammaproteobacteria bacterium]